MKEFEKPFHGNYSQKPEEELNGCAILVVWFLAGLFGVAMLAGVLIFIFKILEIIF